MGARTYCDNCGSSDGLKTTESGTYCFSCGKTSGTWTREERPTYSTEVCWYDGFPPAALKILMRSGLTEALREKYAIKYLDSGKFTSSKGKSFTVVNKIMVTVGPNQYTLRSIGNDKPKWLHINTPKHMLLTHMQPLVKRLIIVVEDPFSAIRVHNAGYDAVCLFGTKLFNETRLQLIQHYDKILIWLDDDKAGDTGKRNIYNNLVGIMGPSRVKLVFGTPEPKLCTDRVILGTIGEAL